MADTQTTKTQRQSTIQKLMLRQVFEEDYASKEAYKSLRTNIQFCGNDIKIIAVTSCQAHEGKSTISMGLAKCFSENSKKVLLIDADMRRSSMASLFATKGGIPGLSQFLTGQAPLNETLFETQYPNFFVMFCGYYPPNPVELLGSEDFKKFLDIVREFDYVIIDTPPIGAVIDAAVIAKLCDGIVLIIDDDKISARFANECKAQLEKSGCRILGAVLNQIKRKQSSYYKRYNKKYYKEYYTKDKKDDLQM